MGRTGPIAAEHSRRARCLSAMALRRWFVIFTLAVCGALSAAAQRAVTTSQYDAARTGANLSETRLTPKNVNATQFGKLGVLRVDGAVYAQPLYVPGVAMPGKGTHDVVFVATEHDSIYAFDASGTIAEPLWRVSFLNAADGIGTVQANNVRCPFLAPEIGITPTPVIDERTGTLYVLARTKEHKGILRDDYMQRLHALAITTGMEKFGGPVEIRASGFDPLRENPRAALLLTDGRVYLSWGSSCDVKPYHGWVMAYDEQSLRQLAAFNTSPEAGESGIWASDTGLAADGQGNVFAATGNGEYTRDRGGRDYGDTVLKLRIEGGRLAVADSFTPHDQRSLNAHDADLGSGGTVLLPPQPGLDPNLLLVGGKGGALYAIDRDRMGGYQPHAEKDAVQTTVFPRALFGASAYWNGHVYAVGANDAIREFALRQGEMKPGSSGTDEFPDGGATPAVSANGTRDGIVWAIESLGWREGRRPAVLHAYDALNVARELYTSGQNAERDRAGNALRFTIPTIANGRVYVGGRGEVDVYGLLAGR